MIVIGADTHKGSHALAAVDEGTGKVRGSREIKADDAGHLAAVRWAGASTTSACGRSRTAGRSRGGLSRRCWPPASGSSGSPPQRMGASRKGEREPGKSDEIDALAVARAVVKDGVESSRSRTWTSGRWRSACCSITATISSPSEPGR